MLFTILLTLCLLYTSFITFPKKTFRAISAFAGPVIRLYILKRISDGLEDKDRKNERFGIPSKIRPQGKLIWIHAVSVGETLSLIPFIEEFKKLHPDLNILITTTTVTSAKLVTERLKDTVIHQFAPFDVFAWIRRFIKYWKPDAAFFVESELWPNTLYYLHEKDIPTYLLNVRISSKSLKRMYLAKKFFKILPFSLFKTVFVPSTELRDHVRELGASEVAVVPNLKMIAKRLPVNQKNVEKLTAKISGRKVWMAVSTHNGEEKIIVEVHKKLRDAYPDILTVIAIRHTDRADDVVDLCASFGLSAGTYSTSFDNDLEIKEDVFILDKMGCLGEFFEAIDTVLVCGSLVPDVGGHNFLEPMQFMCNVATGEYKENFQDIYTYVEKYCKTVKTSSEICKFVTQSLNSYSRNPEMLKVLDFAEKWKKHIKQISKSIYNS